jgi:hypothetical protein
MSVSDGWKRHLLTSGVPLEHEVAQILVDCGFFIDSEFHYLRRAGSEEKELSVDVLGRWYGSDSNAVPFTLNLLAECKYRSRDKTILLFEDPNVEGPNATLGHTIASVDACVPYHLNNEIIYSFENQFPFAYKAVELHKGGAHEQDMRHGIGQLTYAAPALMGDEIASAIRQHPDDRCAIFLTKLLITNAPLRLVGRNVDVSQVEAANELEEVSSPIDAAIMLAPLGPDIDEHCRRAFKCLSDASLSKSARELEGEFRRMGKISPSYYPSIPKYLEDLARAGYQKKMFVSQTFICTTSYLRTLICDIHNVVERSYEERSIEKKGRFDSSDGEPPKQATSDEDPI